MPWKFIVMSKYLYWSVFQVELFGCDASSIQGNLLFCSGRRWLHLQAFGNFLYRCHTLHHVPRKQMQPDTLSPGYLPYIGDYTTQLYRDTVGIILCHNKSVEFFKLLLCLLLLSLVSLLMATCVGSAVPASLDLTLLRFRPLKVDWLKFFWWLKWFV